MVPPTWGCNCQMLVPRAQVGPENNGEAGAGDLEDVTMPYPNQQDAAEENSDLDNFQRLILMTETVNKLQRQMNASRQIRHMDTMHTSTFGCVNGYKINLAQELVTISVIITIDTLFHAYPATGSFPCSTLKSKSTCAPPLAGLSTGIVVIVALYRVTPTFFWILNATLSMPIIHAITGLVALPTQSFSFLLYLSQFNYLSWPSSVCQTTLALVHLHLCLCSGSHAFWPPAIPLSCVRPCHSAKPDALSRHVDHQPEGDDNEDQIMLPAERFIPEPLCTPNEHLATEETNTESSHIHIETEGSDIMDRICSCTD